MFTEDGDFSLTVKSSCWPKGVDVPPASELGQFIQSFIWCQMCQTVCLVQHYEASDVVFLGSLYL